MLLDKIKDLFYILTNELIEQEYLPKRFDGWLKINLFNGKITNVEKKDNLKF